MKFLCIVKLFAVILLSVFLYSCGNNKPGEGKKSDKDGISYGGVLNCSEQENFQTLFPPAIADIVSSNIANQIYDGLVQFNPQTLAIEPSIAEKWTIDSSGTEYTFYLKKGVYFHDNLCFKNNKGREVNAADFKYCFEQLCTPFPSNANFHTSFKSRVLGANQYYNESVTGKPDSGLAGVQVIDNYTLKIKLHSPDNTFLYLLANPLAFVYPKEAFELYNENVKVGTGPFVFEEGKSTADKIVLSRNHRYHQKDSLGNALPYLDSVVVFILSDKDAELQAFKKGKLDYVIGLPTETVSNVVQKEIEKFKGDSAEYMLDRMPEMITQYYAFNVKKAPFDNVKVRQAFSYAINKKKIVEDVLNGEAYAPGDHGITPPAFRGYDITGIKGYTYDPAKAKKLLAEAGYPDGKGFPKIKIELNSGGKKHTSVALEIQQQLSAVLGIKVDIDVVTLAQKMEDAKFGRGHIFRSGWIADYPDPESFLTMLYGENVPDDNEAPSFPNTMRYKNAEFDKLFKEGRTLMSMNDAYAKYLLAEQVAMNDAPFIVLWYDENYRITRSHVKNLINNPMRYQEYSLVYLKKRE